MSMVNVGVVGLGVGFRHAQTILGNSSAHLRSVCDFDDSKFERLAHIAPHLKYFKSYDEMIENSDLDLVCICSEDKFHFQQTKTALERGLHCFVEKPICQTRSQLEELSDLASLSRNIQIRSNFVLREEEAVRQLKSRISSGFLGDIYLIETSYDYGRWFKVKSGWRGKDANYSGVLGGAIHLVDLIMYLFEDSLVVEFVANGSINANRDNVPFPDLVYAICRLGNGAIVKISSNLASGSRHCHQLKIYGSSGTFTLSDRQVKYFFGDDRSGNYEVVESQFPSGNKSLPLQRMISDINAGADRSQERARLFQTIETCFSILDLAPSGG